MLYLSALADEISPDLSVQIETLLREDIYHLELRGLNGKNVLDLEDEELIRTRQELDRHQIRVSAIGSPIGKYPIGEPFEPHYARFQLAVEIAKLMGTRYIRVFSFRIPREEPIEKYRDEVIARMARMVRYAEEQDVVVLLENEGGLYGESPRGCRDLFDAIPSDHFRCTFDAANFILGGYNPLEEAYPLLRDRIEYLHIKDAIRDPRQIVPAGQGTARYTDLLHQLKESGFHGFASLEPHLFRSEKHTAADRPVLFRQAAQALKQTADEAGVPWKTLNVGVLGYGNIGQWHVKAIGQIPNARVKAIWHLDPNLREVNGIPVFTELESVLSNRSIDLVTIATPSGMHGELAVKAARAGKHVLVEKPLEITLEKIDAIIRAVREAGVKCGVVSQFRFTRGMQEVKEAVSSGKLGKIVLGDAYIKWYRSQEYYDSGQWRGTWKLDGGGALMNQSIHYVDNLLWIMGEVDTVMAQTGTLAHERIEVEDVACAVLRYKSGAIGVIQGTTAAYPGSLPRIEIHGTNGSITMEYDQVVYRALKDEPAWRPEKAGAAWAGVGDPKVVDISLVIHQISDFVEAVLCGRDPMITMEQGRKAVSTILAIYESGRTGTAVCVDEFAGNPGSTS